jgi:formyl-CoA transferase/CoA:oxalate CoA-transferase
VKPLEGIRVLELSRVLAGPYVTMVLGNFGAEVIKVEQPGVGDDTRAWGPPFVGGEAAYFLSVNCNKKSVTIDLKHPEGRQIIHRLAERSDIVVENFRPGTADKLDIGYQHLRAINPRLIYCSISGFGQTGPYRHRPGYDAIAQAMSGIMSVTGYPDLPPARAGVAIADIGAGMWALVGILAALVVREKTGRGQWIDISLLDGQVAWLTYLAGNYSATGQVPERHGSAHPNIVPYQAFPTRDGFVMVTVGNNSLWCKFTSAIGMAELADDPRFRANSERVTHRELLCRIISERMQAKTSAEWIEILDAEGVPIGPINTVADVFDDPHIQAREMLVELQHPAAGAFKVVGVPVKFSETPAGLEAPSPLLGQHTEEVLAWLSYTREQVRRLQDEGVV